MHRSLLQRRLLSHERDRVQLVGALLRSQLSQPAVRPGRLRRGVRVYLPVRLGLRPEQRAVCLHGGELPERLLRRQRRLRDGEHEPGLRLRWRNLQAVHHSGAMPERRLRGGDLRRGVQHRQRLSGLAQLRLQPGAADVLRAELQRQSLRLGWLRRSMRESLPAQYCLQHQRHRLPLHTAELPQRLL